MLMKMDGKYIKKKKKKRWRGLIELHEIKEVPVFCGEPRKELGLLYQRSVQTACVYNTPQK